MWNKLDGVQYFRVPVATMFIKLIFSVLLKKSEKNTPSESIFKRYQNESADLNQELMVRIICVLVYIYFAQFNFHFRVSSFFIHVEMVSYNVLLTKS